MFSPPGSGATVGGRGSAVGRDGGGYLRRFYLHNESAALPLDASKLGNLAVIGPHAGRSPMGGYTDVSATGGVSVFDALTALLPEVEVIHAEGCRVTEGQRGASAWWTDDEIVSSPPGAQPAMIADAVSVAAGADVLVLVIGGDESTAREGWSLEHLGDRDSIDLPGAQPELVEAIASLDQSVIAVVTGVGRWISLRSSMLAPPWFRPGTRARRGERP
jgi:beta-glucosidase